MLYVFLGGGLGSVLRYLISLAAWRVTSIAWLGTLIVNVLGSFVFLFLITRPQAPWKGMDHLVKIGFLGALTTFSTFSYNIFQLVKDGRWSEAALCFFLNIFFGILVGIWMFR